MTTPFCKTVGAAISSLKWTILPPLVLAADFIAVLAVSIIVLWLTVIIPVKALAEEAPRQEAPASATTSAADHS